MNILLKIPFENTVNHRLYMLYVQINFLFFFFGLDWRSTIILAIIIQAHRRDTCGCISVGDRVLALNFSDVGSVALYI